eukprot:4406805-Amphidinium_carterae.1
MCEDLALFGLQSPEVGEGHHQGFGACILDMVTPSWGCREDSQRNLRRGPIWSRLRPGEDLQRRGDLGVGGNRPRQLPYPVS